MNLRHRAALAALLFFGWFGIAAAQQQMLGLTPLGRFGDPEDVARAVRFLASDDAAFITGEVMVVGGGLGM